MSFIVCLLVLLFAVVASAKLYNFAHYQRPVSVNYHFNRTCNKACGFCFHTATTSHMETIDQAKRGLLLLKQAGMQKINFAGGEPFLHAKFLGELVNFCKKELQLESVSIVTNGSLVKERFFKEHGSNLDILAVSCDSFNEATNISIGRGSGNQVPQLYKLRSWCKKYGVKFKINTVVCKLNCQEDMNKHIQNLQPFRWKCFQVLMVAGENDSSNTLRDVRKFLVTDTEYYDFCQRHAKQTSFVAESNSLMAKSYLILDEYMKFLDRNGGNPSPSILEVGVKKALQAVFWDEKAFKERGGIYDWSRDQLARNEVPTELDW